jgi:hypothetical protein
LVTVLAVAGFSIAAGDAAPTNQSPPTISGTTTVGSVLTASSGSWNGTTPITYAYQWRRCDSDGGSCASISGAIDKTYVLKSVDAGNTMRVRVTAKNSDGSNAASRFRPLCDGSAATSANGCPAGSARRTSPAMRLLIDGQSARRPRVPLDRPHGSSRLGVVAAVRVLVYATAVPFAQHGPPATR